MRPVKAVPSIDKHVIIKRHAQAGLEAERRSSPPSSASGLRKRVSYQVTKTTVTLTVKNVRTADAHARQMWVARIMGGLKKRGVTAKMAQLLASFARSPHTRPSPRPLRGRDGGRRASGKRAALRSSTASAGRGAPLGSNMPESQRLVGDAPGQW